ncbi:MAG: hypothetical protein L0I62_09755 [Gammaproteobacteria bacterium]|nr:hypothetical protein [Gammaproteobacteria bacterium]
MPPAGLKRLRADFAQALDKLAQTRAFGKPIHQSRLLGLAAKLLASPRGLEVLDQYAPAFEQAGVFAGSDWDQPEHLDAGLVRGSLLGHGTTLALECLSELRMLAIADGRQSQPRMSAEDAKTFLSDVLARNLDLLFPSASEQNRSLSVRIERIRLLLDYLQARIGMQGILAALAAEAERVLLQRPIMVDRVHAMVRAAANAMPVSPQRGSRENWRFIRRLIEAMEGPTELSRASGDAETYARELRRLDEDKLREEAIVFGQSMRRTGLVCPLHAPLLHHLLESEPRLLHHALGLRRVGRASIAAYPALVEEMIRMAVWPETARCIYGLYGLLERGVLFYRPVAPGLRRLLKVPLLDAVAQELVAASGYGNPPPANALLVAGTLSVLGQPRGVDQGHNPTCQSARAISLWSQNDTGFLLGLIADAARDGDVVMQFEGEEIHSSTLDPGLAVELHTELDPISLLLTPHIDRIYMEMSRRTADRGEDGHRWVNPELHGWWVARGFASAVHEGTGSVHGLEAFVRLFYASYHPEFNGGRDMVYVQPCGIAVTNYEAVFVGWHAVSIQRVGRDDDGDWRVYFFNPNRDKGQNWGQGVVTSTANHGELEGESSLPFAQFASRLYVFHYLVPESGDPAAVPVDLVTPVIEAARASWAAGMPWSDARLDG